MTIPESVLPDGGWAGVVLVQLTLLALLGFVAWLAAWPRGPALRGAVLLAALAGLLLTPLAARVVPVWLPLPEWGSSAPAEPPSVSVAEAPPPALVASDDFTFLVTPPPEPSLPEAEDPMKKAGEDALTAVKAEVFVFSPAPVAEEPAPAPPPLAAAESSLPLPNLLAALWGLGAAFCLSRALLRLLLLYRCAARAVPVVDREWSDWLGAMARRHGLEPVALRESPQVVSPLTLGLFRALILLPAGWRGWPAQQRRLILGHEMAHVQRRDFVAGLVAELAACLCWFHPLVRWLVGRLRLEQEYAADAWVASALADPKDYVRCLARLALERDRGRGSLAPGFWRRRPEIMRRIDMLRRNPKGLPARLEKKAAWTVALLTAAACLAAGGVGRLHSAADAPKSSADAPGAQEQQTADLHGDPLPAGARARLGTTRLRHGAEVTFVAFGPEGKTLLTAGRDSTVRLWDLASGKEIRRFDPPRPPAPKPPAKKGKGKTDKAEVQVEVDAQDALVQMMAGGGNNEGSLRLATSPDGKTLAVANGGAIQLYDVASGQSLRKIEAAANGFNGLLFSPDGRTLAGRSGNNTLFLWATESGKEVRQIKPPARPRQNGIVFIVGGGEDGGGDAPGMGFSPDGKVLAAAATDYKGEEATRSVKLWDLETGKEVRRIKAPDNVGVVSVAPNGETLVYSNGNVIHLCDVKTGKEVRRINTGGGRIVTLAFAPDGKTLAVRARNQRVGLWDVQTGKELRQLSEAHAVQRTGGAFFFISGFSSPETRALAISPDGKQVASASGSSVRLWETATGKEVGLSDGHRKAPSTLVVSRDGKTVISWADDRVVRRWEAATGKLLGTFPAPAGTTRAALSPDGRLVALANIDNTIRLHDVATGKQLHRMEGHPTGTIALAFAPDGKVLGSRGAGDGIRFYDVAAGRLLRHIDLRPVRNAGQGGAVIIFGGDDGARASGPGLAFTPDGKLLATAGPRGDGSLVLMDVATGKELRKVKLPQPVTSLAFAPDGRTLATENADRTITLWEAASGKMRAQMGNAVAGGPQRGRRMRGQLVVAGLGGGGGGEPAGPVGLAYSPDGRALISRGADQSVHVWDMHSGKAIGRLQGHRGRVETVAFAADGKTLASGATDTTILLWDASGPLEKLAGVQAAELSGKEAESLWGDLARDDGAAAYRGVQKLTAGGRQAVPFLARQLKPAARIDPHKIQGWITQLDSEKYAVRKEASERLFKVGAQAVPPLRKVLASSPPLETRKRVEELLEKLTGGTLSAEQLRLIRAVEVLERVGTPEAKNVLRALAQGAPGELSTLEAEAALERLGGSPAARP